MLTQPRFMSKKEREVQRAKEADAAAQAEAARLERAKQERLAWEKHASSEPAAEQAGPAPEPDTETDEALRQRYLGMRPTRNGVRKMRRSNDPTKRFLFEWDQDEDTSDPTLLAGAEQVPVRGQAGIATSHPTAKALQEELHWSEKPLDAMKERDWRIFREDYGIVAKGGQIPPPLRSWREAAIPAAVLDAIEQIGYKEPSPIQRQAIPIGLEGRDLIGIAETGSGKTASFVIPMLAHVAALPRRTEENAHLGPYALIMSPTRELAQQIEAETRKLVAKLGVSVVSVVGGRDVGEQAFHLQRGAEIVIATPGRLKDLLEQHIVMLGECNYLVLDEADRMVDMNYEAELDYILASLPAAQAPNAGDTQRVTMLYSATMPPYVEKIARTYLRKPATVLIGNAGQAVGTVDQHVEFVEGEAKRKYVHPTHPEHGCWQFWTAVWRRR